MRLHSQGQPALASCVCLPTLQAHRQRRYQCLPGVGQTRGYAHIWRSVAKNKVRKVGITKQKVGAGCPEPAGEAQPTLVETAVNRRGDNTPRSCQ